MTPIEQTLRCLTRWQYDLSTEAALQGDAAKALTLGMIAFKREVSLSEHDRIDFYLPDAKIGIEVKLKCAARQIFRQIERYADSDRIEAIILLSNTALGLPGQIKGKPVHIVHAGMCAL